MRVFDYIPTMRRRTVYCHIETALGDLSVTISQFRYYKEDGGIIIEDISHNAGRGLTDKEQEEAEQSCFSHLEERKEQLSRIREESFLDK